MTTRSWALENLLGNRRVEVRERSQLVHNLRHRNVQNLYHGHDVGELLHGALLDPFLSPPAAHPDRVAGNRQALPQTTGRAPSGGVGCPRTSPCSASRTHLPGPVLPMTLLRCGTFVSDRAIATLRRSCRRNCLSRRSHSLRAALTLSTSITASTAEAVSTRRLIKMGTLAGNGLGLLWLLVVGLWVCGFVGS